MAIKVEMNMPMEEGIQAYNLQEAVLKEVGRRGFAIPDEPMQVTDSGAVEPYRGELPPNLTELTDQELGVCMSMLSSYIAFIGTQKALADVSFSISKAQLEFVEAKLRLTHKTDEEGKKYTIQERDDLVKNDPRFVEVNRVTVYFESSYKLLVAKCKESDQNFAAVSRRITQRGQEVGNYNRVNNAESQPVPTFPRKTRGR